MALTDEEIADILQASAHSERPIDEGTIRRIAEESSMDPDLLVQRSEEIRELVERRKRDKGDPMPMTFT